MKRPLSFKILDQIPIGDIHKYLSEQNASEKQNGGKGVGSDAASRKAKKDALTAMVKKMAL